MANEIHRPRCSNFIGDLGRYITGIIDALQQITKGVTATAFFGYGSLLQFFRGIDLR
jgi:hypothetical protein